MTPQAGNIVAWACRNVAGQHPPVLDSFHLYCIVTSRSLYAGWFIPRWMYLLEGLNFCPDSLLDELIRCRTIRYHAVGRCKTVTGLQLHEVRRMSIAFRNDPIDMKVANKIEYRPVCSRQLRIK